jgi:hypothetical protein
MNFIFKVAEMGWEDHQNVEKGGYHDKNHTKRSEGRDPTIGLFRIAKEALIPEYIYAESDGTSGILAGNETM